MNYASFLATALALLLAPGPTNTLMALAGAQKGLASLIRFLPAELLGYLTAVLPLAWVGSRLLERWPTAAATIKVVAAIWVMYLAVKLWGVPFEKGGKNQVTAGRVYLTTVLNPKALIFGLILVPAPVDAQFLPKIGLLSLSATAVALIWGSAGALTHVGRAGGTRMGIVQRIASIWLSIVSVTLLASLFEG
ncbi:MAG: hypothetical protein EOS28_30630 [Mesorhizobium sp.]|nr:MAG: hypothetical protein EOS28_30630 [Mesorhizobium sp.]